MKVSVSEKLVERSFQDEDAPSEPGACDGTSADKLLGVAGDCNLRGLSLSTLGWPAGMGSPPQGPCASLRVPTGRPCGPPLTRCSQLDWGRYRVEHRPLDPPRGENKKEVMRCLKRYLVRELYPPLQQATTTPTADRLVD